MRVQVSKLQCVKLNYPGSLISKVIPQVSSREQGGLPGCGVYGRTSGAGTGVPASPDDESGSLTNVINVALSFMPRSVQTSFMAGACLFYTRASRLTRASFALG